MALEVRLSAPLLRPYLVTCITFPPHRPGLKIGLPALDRNSIHAARRSVRLKKLYIMYCSYITLGCGQNHQEQRFLKYISHALRVFIAASTLALLD